MARPKNSARNNFDQASLGTGLVDVEVTGDDKSATSMLAGFDRAFDPIAISYNLLQDRVYPRLEERARERFANEGDDTVGQWAQLKPFTQDMREKGGFGPAHPINVRTGALKRHVLEQAPDVIPVPGGGVLWFPKRGGTAQTVKKMTTAQKGDTRTVPRPVVGLGLRDMEDVLIAIGLHIAQNQAGVAGGGMF